MQLVRKVLLTSALIASNIFAANAAESPAYITPIGGTDTNQAILPPVSGFYGGVVFIPSNFSTNYIDYKGNNVPANWNIRMKSDPIEALALLYVWPFHPFGGSISSSIVASYASENWNSPVISPLGTTEGRGSVSGVRDNYYDLFFWSKSLGLMGVTPGKMPLPYGLFFGAGLALTSPNGEWQPQPLGKSVFLNIGTNDWTIIPNFALTYTTGPDMSIGDSTQISMRLFYGHAFENPATHYSTGDSVDIDFSVTQRFGPLMVGVAGDYYAQIANDTTAAGTIPSPRLPFAPFTNPLVAPKGNRVESLTLGPIVQYDIPEWQSAVKIKYEWTPYARQELNEQALVLEYLFKLP